MSKSVVEVLTVRGAVGARGGAHACREHHGGSRLGLSRRGPGETAMYARAGVRTQRECVGARSARL